jgi:hypothetical protein
MYDRKKKQKEPLPKNKKFDTSARANTRRKHIVLAVQLPFLCWELDAFS